MSEEVSWDEAVSGGNFITLEDAEPKELLITNWKLLKVEKNFNKKVEEKVEFQCEVVEEDGEPCEKVLNTVSNRFKTKLRDILEGLASTGKIRIIVTKMGDGFGTQYAVKLAKKKKVAEE